MDEVALNNVFMRYEEVDSDIKRRVTSRFKVLDTEVYNIFNTGAKDATSNFKNTVDEEISKKKRNQTLTAAVSIVVSPVGGLIYLLATDSLSIDIKKIFDKALTTYENAMDTVIDNVTNLVEKGFNDVYAIIDTGRAEIEEVQQGLDPQIQDAAAVAANKILGNFDTLEKTVENKRAELISGMTSKYEEYSQELDTFMEQKREECTSFVDRAKEALLGVYDTIIGLRDMLLEVLSSAAGVVDRILLDPIRFLKHLIRGVGQGLENFVTNIWKHLKQGFLDWLFGALAEGGIQMPKSFDLPSILTLVLDVLGITYDKIKAKVAKVVGEEKVVKIEKAIEIGQKIAGYAEGFRIFQILRTEGFAGLWEYIKDKTGDLKEVFLKEIKGWVVSEAIKGGYQMDCEPFDTCIGPDKGSNWNLRYYKILH